MFIEVSKSGQNETDENDIEYSELVLDDDFWAENEQKKLQIKQ